MSREKPIENYSQVTAYASALLREADALGRIPTPVDDLAQTARIVSIEDLNPPAGAPARILHLFQKIGRKLLAALDFRERTIFLDRSVSEERQRFNKAHELGHQVLPWHQEAYWADDSYTLSEKAEEILELYIAT